MFGLSSARALGSMMWDAGAVDQDDAIGEGGGSGTQENDAKSRGAQNE